jgi:glyoxylase-like metal-dependent hydrolase (beta-lactamase superfamily II)
MISEGIYQLEVPMKRNPLGKTYSYLIRETSTLIDTGVPTQDAYDGLEKELGRYDVKPRDIEHILVTHLHNDHIGLTDVFADYGAEIWASEIAEKREEQFSEQWEDMYHLVRKETRTFGGEEYLDKVDNYKFAFRRNYEKIHIDRKIKDGEYLDLDGVELKGIWTPGHAPEHMVYYLEDERLLFSGDHVLPKITSHISLHSYEDRDPLGDYLDSLIKIEDLEVRKVLPAHEWTFDNLKERAEEIREHHKKRLQEIKNTLTKGEVTVYDIGKNIHWDSRPWPEMDFWTKRMAAAETYAHIVYLQNNSEVEESEKNGVLYYSLS